MNHPSRTSFRQYSLRHEWLAGAIGAALLIGAGALSLEVLRGRYLELQRIESNRVKHHLQVHLDEAQQQLQTFLRLPPSQWEPQAEVLLPFFSDLYVLDSQLQVHEVIKASPGSRVFAGFSFAGSSISDHLGGSNRRGNSLTPIVRGLEDELTSLYVWQQVAGRKLLARIQLSYIKSFLTRYSAFSGTPTLLVRQDGFILLSGDESLWVATIDFSGPLPTTQDQKHPVAMQPVLIGDRKWLPISSDQSILGARIVTLLPADQLTPISKVLTASCSLLLLLLAIIFTWKNRRLRHHLFDPLAEFAERIHGQEQQLRQGGPPQTLAYAPLPRSDARLRELAGLHTSFGRLIHTIAQRDQALRQAHERERRTEDHQRLVLQGKLRSSLMAASIAHEINLPLATIRLLCRQARDQLAEGGGVMAVEDLISALSLQSQQVSTVTETMRMLLRNVQTEHGPIDPVAVVLSASQSIKPLMRSLDGELEVLGLEPPPMVPLQGDAVQLQMALTNLLRNGLEAAAECPGRRPHLRISLGVEAETVVIAVADNGPGFRFVPSDDTLLQTSKVSGSGLGLFVVRTTVAHHQGELHIDRCPSLGGARVRLHLPLGQPTPLEPKAAVPPEVATEPLSRRPW